MPATASRSAAPTISSRSMPGSRRDYDVEDEAVSLDRIIWALQPVKRLRLILLDACRDNPFAAKLHAPPASARAAKGGLAQDRGCQRRYAGGLSPPRRVRSPTMATAPTAPIATALLKHLAEPGLDIRIALGRVRDEVLNLTARPAGAVHLRLARRRDHSAGAASATTKAVPAPAPPAVVAKREPAPPAPPNIAVAPVKPNPVASPATPVVSAPVVPPNGAVAPAKPAAVAARAAPPVAAPPAKAEPAKPAQPQLAAVEPADPVVACNRDEQRLERLRGNPVPEEIAKFQRELSLLPVAPAGATPLESIATEPQAPGTPAERCQGDRSGEPAGSEDPAGRGGGRLRRAMHHDWRAWLRATRASMRSRPSTRTRLRLFIFPGAAALQRLRASLGRSHLNDGPHGQRQGRHALAITSSAGSRFPWPRRTPCRPAPPRAACSSPRASWIPTAS